ncbi:unnamed protein product [Adineta steineri]|uniref:PB1 domain-containing protein n=1 Tax=Adineta steineri TaxID=433720 RepID=A0A814S129_9BILA|nr:unnamed protein product [Adineta steineri]CAF1141244.1 unnamed protein product [Adineta steineri]
MNSATSTPPPTASSTTMNDDKISDQLIIKAQLGDDIRKMMIHNEDLTLNELVLMMERIFTGKISNSDEITIKYVDDDGDKITLLNDSDLTVALHFHKFLRLFIFVNGAEQTNVNKNDDSINANIFRTELQEIRNSVQMILDRLQMSTNDVSSTTATASSSRELDSHKQGQQTSTMSDNNQVHSNHLANNEHQSVNTQHLESTDINKISQTQMPPTSHFVPSGFNNEQQTKTNIFGPPPTTFPGMPPLPNNAIPQFPPTTNTAPSPHNQPPTFTSQQAPGPPPSLQQSGFYSQQQGLYQQRPSHPGFNTNNTFASQQPPATINSSFIQQPSLPPMNSQQPQVPPMNSQQQYGAYPPQNSYYNPGHQH